MSHRNMLIGLLLLSNWITASADSIVVFNEIHYHPAGNVHSNEFVELFNQNSVDVDMSGWFLDGGIEFQFVEGTVIPGKGYVVVAADPISLEASSGFAQAMGPFIGRLNNDGEHLVLRNNNGRVMDEITYGDVAPWPIAPDGSGVSLRKIDPMTPSDFARMWRAGTKFGGTPGADNSGIVPAAYSGRYFPLNGSIMDVSGAGNGGTLFGGANYTTSTAPIANPGQSVAFDGLDDFGEILDGTDPSEYTISCWVKVDVVRAQSIVVRTSSLGPTTQWSHQLRMTATGRFEHYMFDGAARSLTGTTVVVPDTWYHVAVTAQAGGIFTLHVNGVQEGAPVGMNTPWSGGDRWNIGSNSGHGMNFLSGHVDDLAMWFHVLSPPEIAALASGSSSPGDTLSTVVLTGGLPTLSLQEVAAATSTVFWVELFNDGSEDIDLENMVLGSSAGVEYVFPAQSITGGTRIVVDEVALGFHPAKDDKLFLFTAGKTNVLDAIQVKNRLKGRLPGAPRGNVFTPSAPTPGTTNSFAFVDDIVINEIMFHHRPDYGEPGGQTGKVYRANDEEWIELYNRSAQPVSLYEWEFRDGIRFTFPSNTTMAAGEFLIVARDATAFAEKYPVVPVVGDYQGGLSNRGEELRLVDANNNPVDEVYYADGAPWPGYADGGGSSLELIHPDVDNTVAEAWASSLNDAAAVWTNVSFTVVATNPVFSPGIHGFHELRLGLLEAGEVLIDDVSVVEDPLGANRELIQNGSLNDTAHWRLLGNHNQSGIESDGGESILRIHATGTSIYLYNLLETSLKVGSTLEAVDAGTAYRISFRAKWLHGSPQLHTELFYNKVARTIVLPQPDTHGTPGAINSTYLVNPGPTYARVEHVPAVPAPGVAIPVEVIASDPDGIASLHVHYAVNEGAFQVTGMVLDTNGVYRAEIPGQAASAIIQFYVEGTDGLGAASFYPAAGIGSRALIQVNDGRSSSTLDNFRVIMLPSEATFMHHANELLSNQRQGCTFILDGETILYDAGIRLRGSMFSRRNAVSTGLNLRFPSDRPYRGVHKTITFRRGGIVEILAKHMINHAGGIHDNYNDIMYLAGHIPEQTGPVRMEMTRFGTGYLESLGNNGEEGTVFKMEGIRDIQTTTDGDPESPKIPFPVGWVANFDLTDLGTDPEQYRHSIRINTAKDRDDYSRMVAMCRAFSLPEVQMEAAVPGVIDVSKWMRQFAMLSLLGIGDTYTQGNPHNFNMYVRPGDGIVEPMPWDWDFVYSRANNSPLWGNKNVGRIISRPVYQRLFYCHLHDMIGHTVNRAYTTAWAAHYGALAGENYAGFVNNAEARGNFVLGQLPASIPFSITTGGGNAFAVTNSTVSLQGDAWIDVASFRLNGGSEDFPVTWLDVNTWEMAVPLGAGANSIDLTVFDHQGLQVGGDSIVVTNTGATVAASAANLVISEMMIHPVSNGVEYIELMNIDPVNTLDLTQVAFNAGVDFVFPVNTLLAPLQRMLIVEDIALYETLYGTNSFVAGMFQNGTGLRREGELIALLAADGTVIRSFAYDNNAPWPQEVPQGGHSLVLMAPQTNPDHALAKNWRPSVASAGYPGGSDAFPFHGAPGIDGDGDQIVALVEYVGGTSDEDAGSYPFATIERQPNGDVMVRLPLVLGADDAYVFFEHSPDLEMWTAATEAESMGLLVLGNGFAQARWLLNSNDVDVRYGRFRVELR